MDKSLLTLQTRGTALPPTYMLLCSFGCLLAGQISAVVERVYNASVVLKDSLAPSFSGVKGAIKYSLPPNSSD